MHLTLKKEATRPPGFNSLQQQERFDAFFREFNSERPHEALDMKCPAERYVASTRPYDGLPELTYPLRCDYQYSPNGRNSTLNDHALRC
jgi:Integrase core domain